MPTVKHWVSTARWRNSSSQWAGPVVILKAAGTRRTFAPERAIRWASSGKRKSKQMHRPILPQGVSNTVTSEPGERVADSRKDWPPGTSMSKRCSLRWRAAQRPEGSKT